ncbi:MAG: DUF2029 domain-containing protein [Planctomycetes bacterium]|nr:DUF2029 domain-containing protein [Planctomycetota bacterium]
MSPVPPGTRGPLALLLAGAVACAASGPLAERPALFLAAYLCAGAGWLLALGVARRGAVPLRLVVAVAVLLRVVALVSDAGTSDDVHRIPWEGRVLLEGRSPYAFAPDAPELLDLRAARPAQHAAVNHPDVPAAYPPLVLAVGALAAWLEPGDEPGRAAWIVRALFTLCDLALLLPLVLLLRARALPEGLAVAWAWSPLAAFEIAGGGHLEALALAPLLGALALSERARGPSGHAGAGLLFGLAVLAKLLPIVLLPWFARGPHGLLRAGVALAAVGAAYAPWVAPSLGVVGAERGVLGGLSEYALRWEAASLVHRFVEGALALRFPYDLSATDPRRLARLALACAWSLWALWTWRRERDPARAALDVLGAWIVISPVFHPWYALWAVPWLALRRSHAFAWLACAAPLAFAPAAAWQRGGAWTEPAWLWPVLAVPCAVLLCVDARSARRPAPGAAT